MRGWDECGETIGRFGCQHNQSEQEILVRSVDGKCLQRNRILVALTVGDWVPRYIYYCAGFFGEAVATFCSDLLEARRQVYAKHSTKFSRRSVEELKSQHHYMNPRILTIKIPIKSK